MALKTLRFVQGLPRTPLLFCLRYFKTRFPKRIFRKSKISKYANLKIGKPRFANKCPVFVQSMESMETMYSMKCVTWRPWNSWNPLNAMEDFMKSGDSVEAVECMDTLGGEGGYLVVTATPHERRNTSILSAPSFCSLQAPLSLCQRTPQPTFPILWGHRVATTPGNESQ